MSEPPLVCCVWPASDSQGRAAILLRFNCGVKEEGRIRASLCDRVTSNYLRSEDTPLTPLFARINTARKPATVVCLKTRQLHHNSLANFTTSLNICRTRLPKMDPSPPTLANSPLPFLHLMQGLKHLPRTGWLRTVSHPESVASHSFRLALLGSLAPVSFITNSYSLPIFTYWM